MKDGERYTASLTGEPFLFNDTRMLAGFLVRGEDIAELKKRNLSDNLIMHKKIGSLKRVNTPIFRRLATMSQPALQILAGTDLESANLILLIAIAKTDRLVGNFILYVYADKLAIRASTIDKSDIEKYFESVFAEEPYLRDRSVLTIAKLKQQLMKIVTEAGLTKKQGVSFEITRPHVTDKLANQLIADGDEKYLRALGGNL